MPLNDPWKWPEYPVPPVRAAVPLAVYKFVGPGNYVALPNVVCLSIENHEGADPGSASFRYVMDSRLGGPYTVEQALSTAYTGSLIVEVGDRLVVAAQRPDGVAEWIFDGYPVGWGGHLDGKAEGVAMQAIGVAKRAWDRCVPGRLMRHSDLPLTGEDVETDLIARCNPRGQANASPKDHDSGEGSGPDDRKYPVFLDELLPADPDTPDDPYQQEWTIAMLARYLCYTCNADEEFVANPPGGRLDAVLVTRKPNPGQAIDPADESTYTAEPIKAPDFPLTGQRWPAALRKLTEDYGIGMRFQLLTVADAPRTQLQFFWTQSGPAKSIYLDARGSDFDAARNNVGQADMDRDLSGVINEVVAEGGLQLYEASFVLACGFPMAAADAASPSAIAAFREGDPAYATSDNFNKYRLFVFDECGEGHYDNGTNTKLTDVPSLDDLLGEDEYVRRRRPGKGDLLTADALGKPLKWRCSISTDYDGDAPALWDGTGHWQHVGGVNLLRDRLGVRISITDPNAWNVGRPPDADPQTKSQIVKAVKCLADPDDENPAFFVRLTCVVEGDRCVAATAERQSASPVSWVVEERVDARDRLFQKTIGYPSEFNTPDDGVLDVIEFFDDTPFLEAESIAVRQANEAGVFHAEVMIPYFTRYYEVGDRIDKIEGRELGFRTDGGGGSVMPVLPMVTSVRWELGDGQRTILTLSDRGMDHARRRKPRTRASRHSVPLDPRAGFVKGSTGLRTGAADWTPVSERDNG
jgi:hypothetical protein